jgi:hypothetical protein
MVARLTESARASSRSAGNRVPGVKPPLVMLRSIAREMY